MRKVEIPKKGVYNVAVANMAFGLQQAVATAMSWPVGELSLSTRVVTTVKQKLVRRR